MVRKAKANAGIAPFGEKKQETLIELQDSKTYTTENTQPKMMQQQQEQMNLRMLEEQEASIRQLEVKSFTANSCTQMCYYLLFAEQH